MNVCELRQKEVINCANCKRLGYVSDVEFNIHSGKITFLIVPGFAHIWGMFGRDTEYWIPVEKICQVGTDIILVDIQEEECLKKCSFEQKN